MRILICGARDWTDSEAIKQELVERLSPTDTIIEGEANGADAIAREVALSLAMNVNRYPANWEQYGKAADPIRNQQMLDEGKPHEVWAFHHDLRASRGTADMVRRANRAGVLVRVFDGKAER